jgi:NTP pyrophosphatase (non-canonical NTP hydrolase)
MMCIEECAELIDALAKYDRGRADTKDVITELADVCIMVEQMAMLFGKEEFEKEKERKLKRLQEKIDEASNL